MNITTRTAFVLVCALGVGAALGAIGLLLVGSTRWALAAGTADAAGTPAAATMRFRIGSITKPIITALALDQVDQGALSLDRDITALVGPPLRTSPPVTLRNLLDHTSGIFDIGNQRDTVSIVIVDADRPDRGLVAAFNSTDDQTGLGGLGELPLCGAGSSE